MTPLTLWRFIDLSCDGSVCRKQQRIVGRSWAECTSKALMLGWALDMQVSQCLCPACAATPRNTTVH